MFKSIKSIYTSNLSNDLSVMDHDVKICGHVRFTVLISCPVFNTNLLYLAPLFAQLTTTTFLIMTNSLAVP